jgi:hypothetical protein
VRIAITLFNWGPDDRTVIALLDRHSAGSTTIVSTQLSSGVLWWQDNKTLIGWANDTSDDQATQNHALVWYDADAAHEIHRLNEQDVPHGQFQVPGRLDQHRVGMFNNSAFIAYDPDTGLFAELIANFPAVRDWAITPPSRVGETSCR